ncbi:MAG: hypothetical protein U0166_13045 [Acidobacteriota bacterium]
MLLTAWPGRSEDVFHKWDVGDLPGYSKDRWIATKALTPGEMADLNEHLDQWVDAYLLENAVYFARDDRDLLCRLADQVRDGRVTTLAFAKQLIIWERIERGDLFFEGKGLECHDDLFQVAGRANWMLRNATGRCFGYVRVGATQDDRNTIGDRWQRYFEGAEVEEVPFPYAGEKVKEEVRDLAAIGAFVTALQPSERKAEHTASCKHDMDLMFRFFMTAHPDLEESRKKKVMMDFNNAIGACDPDITARYYLSLLTGMTDPHDPSWWADWWKSNRDRLDWDETSEQFHVRTDADP